MGLLDFFRGKRASRELTFNERVDRFWRHYASVADRFYETIEGGKCGSLQPETSAMVDELFPGFAWVFGPGANGQGHSFTLSGEGIIHRQLLALQWLARAPALPGWTFYAARQPGRIEGHVVEIDGMRFDPKEIWVAVSIDEEDQNVDITVWHPSWERVAPNIRSTVTFLFLDEAFGEYGTDWWIGQIEFNNSRLSEAIPLQELAEQVAKLAAERGWKKNAPGELFTLYQMEESSGNYPRSDIVTQNTCVPKLVMDYVNAQGELEDPLSEAGADYAYISIAGDFFPPGEQVTKRGEIEDAIEEALKPFGGGRCIGGAFGRERSYSDFLIFDGRRSLEAMQAALRRLNVPPGTIIEFFAREKRGQRIAVT